MKEEIENIDNLIGNLLAGEATAEEKASVEKWISQSVANKVYFEHLRLIFEKTSSNSIHLQVDADVAWQKVKANLKPSKTKQVSYWNVLKIAAGVVWLGFLVFMFMLNRNAKIQTITFSTDKQAREDTLPDGSIAFLNKKSTLLFSFDSKAKTRKVKLKGEAFFAVKHENKKAFVIETEQVMIKDIGTEFNVKAYPNDSIITVSVTSGEVQFYTINNAGLKLNAGEKGLYDKSSKTFSKTAKLDTNVVAYKTKIFTFSNTDLLTVVTSLNDVYDCKISLANDRIKKCRLTVNFNNDRLETILDVIAETLHLTITKTEGEIIFSGSGCTN